MTIKNKNWLFATVVALALGVGVSTYSTNVQAETSNQVQEASPSSDTGDTSGTVKNSDVSYTIKNGTLTLFKGTINGHSDTDFSYPWTESQGQPNTNIINVKINGTLHLNGNAASALFDGMENLKTISGLENLDTSKTNNTSFMFNGDKNLANLNVSKFDTSNVTDMGAMFQSDEKLTNLNVSKFDTSNVTDMGAMFGGDKNLVNLDVSNFNTSNVTDMDGMFTENEKSTDLDVSKFDTSKVTDMAYMFDDDKDLVNLDVSNFNTSNVKNMDYMFSGDEKLTSLNVSKFDTSSTSMWNMFSGDKDLTKLDLSSFNTLSQDTTDMFYGDNNLWQLTLGKYVTNKSLLSLPIHKSNSVIPGSNPVRYAANEGWQAVHPQDNQSVGTTDDPQGAKYDTTADFINQRPGKNITYEINTYVWQQSPTPVETYTLDVNKSQVFLYQGDKSWDPISAITKVQKNGTDIDKSGVTITYQVGKEDKPFTKGTVATLKPGTYTVHYQVGKGNNKVEKDLSLTIKNEAGLNVTKDKSLYVGQPFTDKDFRSEIQTATDVDGTPLDSSRINYQVKDSSGHVLPDPGKMTSKVGKYTVVYATLKLQDGVTHSDTMNVNVAANKTTLNLKKYPNLTITTNQKWKPEDDFENATDIDGNPVAFKDITVKATKDGKTVNDLNNLYKNPGTYKVHYINGSANGSV